MNSVSELKKTLVTACRILDREGVLDELGHFSVRCPERGGVLINGKVSPGQVREEDIILLDTDGNRLEGTLEAALESPLHLAVYRRRPDVMAMVHTHSPKVVTLSIAGIPLRPVENQGASVNMGSPAPVYEEYGLVDNFESGNAVADALGERDICILKSHGNIVVGTSIEATCVSAIWTEKAARYQYEAMLVGQPDWYPENEMKKIRTQQIRGQSHLRTWNYYCWKISSA